MNVESAPAFAFVFAFAFQRIKAMKLQLIDSGWDALFREAINADASSWRVICPFIKAKTVERLLGGRRPSTLHVVTRFDLNLYAQGVSDLLALRRLLEAGAVIRGVRNVHAKVYLFGENRAFVTSANLTDAAMFRNAEFGVSVDDAAIAAECRRYFERLWDGAVETTLTYDRLKQFEITVAGRPNAIATAPGLADEGVDLGLPRETIRPIPAGLLDAPQAFVKFWGESNRRVPESVRVIDEVAHSGSHLACSYPRRPRRVDDGAVVFMGRMTQAPDIRITGRAVARRHDPDRDVASSEDIKRRAWRARYNHLVRVVDPEFVNGTVSDGVSLNELMDALGAKAFRSTAENEASGEGNTDPRLAYRRHAQVELSPAGFHWVNDHLDTAIRNLGSIPREELDSIERRPLPTLPFET